MSASSEASTTSTRIQDAFEALDAKNSLLNTCTLLYRTLSSHFSAVDDTLQQKSEALHSRLQAMETKSAQLQDLDVRQQSISGREFAAAARIEKQKQAALAEFEKPPASADDGNAEMVAALRSYCRKMDATGLRKFVVSRQSDVLLLREEIGPALIEEAVDPARLVLDAFEEFVSQKVVVAEQRWACGVLLRALLFAEVDPSGKLLPVGGRISRRIEEKASAVLEAWRKKMEGKEGGFGGMGAAEGQMFLYMVVGFGLRTRYEEVFLRKLILKFPSRRDMAKLTVALGFQEKIGDIIEELINNGKQLEAVFFAQESGLTEQFPPLPLLKAFFDNMKKITGNILKKGRYCTISWESADNVELNSLRALIRCIEDNKLESIFPVEDLKKRFSRLEFEKLERKKTPRRPKSKRAVESGEADPALPPAKARIPTQWESVGHPNKSTAYTGVYGYPNQGLYDLPATAAYGPTDGGSHCQSPPALRHRHRYVSNDAAVARISGSYEVPLPLPHAGYGHAAAAAAAAVPPHIQSSYP